MLPILHFGPLAIQTPGLVIILGVWIGLNLTERFSSTFQVDPNKLYNLVLISIISGILSARISFVIQNLDIFIRNPSDIFSLNPGLLDPTGGFGIGFIAGLIFVNRKNLNIWSTLDALTPFFGVMIIATALSQLASGDAFGLETNVPWGMELWEAKRHPTQIYYLTAGLVIIFILWPRRSFENLKFQTKGSYFFTFTAMNATTRLFLDAFRGDSTLILYTARTSQVVAWFVLAISLWRLIKIKIS